MYIGAGIIFFRNSGISIPLRTIFNPVLNFDRYLRGVGHNFQTKLSLMSCSFVKSSNSNYIEQIVVS